MPLKIFGRKKGKEKKQEYEKDAALTEEEAKAIPQLTRRDRNVSISKSGRHKMQKGNRKSVLENDIFQRSTKGEEGNASDATSVSESVTSTGNCSTTSHGY
ncbi:unnamed protein product [Dimorphilus gyrociliatus]|uniref:Uncharacterized protein n=1 Tax=Dimorphilus gyrociliatus TaxID=2664684 RepID=A0A7I8VV48_9ANNE|nr:unnamed protein product [Dimorphilus gyrociliatus]